MMTIITLILKIQLVVEECNTEFLINETRRMGMVVVVVMYNSGQTTWRLSNHYGWLVMVVVEVLAMPYWKCLFKFQFWLAVQVMQLSL
jgi:hypothetical protein